MKGFTLIELLVSIMVISLLTGTIAGLFVSVVKNQTRILTYQELLSQTSYALEKMSRALRMAKKELNCTDPLDPSTCSPSNPSYCLTSTGYGYNFETNPLSNNKIRFINPLENNDCQEFFLQGNQLKYKKDATNPMAPILDLTSSDFQVSDFKFKLSGQGQEDNLQPRVTLILTLQAADNEPKIKVQTTISQRNLDIKR